jgi:hypothetical protein
VRARLLSLSIRGKDLSQSRHGLDEFANGTLVGRLGLNNDGSGRDFRRLETAGIRDKESRSVSI